MHRQVSKNIAPLVTNTVRTAGTSTANSSNVQSQTLATARLPGSTATPSMTSPSSSSTTARRFSSSSLSNSPLPAGNNSPVGMGKQSPLLQQTRGLFTHLHPSGNVPPKELTLDNLDEFIHVFHEQNPELKDATYIGIHCTDEASVKNIAEKGYDLSQVGRTWDGFASAGKGIWTSRIPGVSLESGLLAAKKAGDDAKLQPMAVFLLKTDLPVTAVDIHERSKFAEADHVVEGDVAKGQSIMITPQGAEGPLPHVWKPLPPLAENQMEEVQAKLEKAMTDLYPPPRKSSFASALGYDDGADRP